MVQRRDIVVCIILSIVTCGIYGLYWMSTLTDDMNQLTGDYSTSGVTAVVFTIITCGIYGLYWMYKQGEKLDNVKAQRGYPTSNSALLFLVLAIFRLGIVSYAIMQNEINNFA